MFTQIGQFLIESLFGFFVYLLLLRFYMQWLRAPFRNPIGEFVAALTNWMVLPARRLIPSLFGLDFASLALAWLAEVLMWLLMLWLRGFSPAGAPGVGRNTLNGPGLATVDARFTRDIRLYRERVGLKLIFEAFNLTNRANYNAVTVSQYNYNNATRVFTPNPAYLQRTSTFDPRILQLAAKITF
mgnify:CR=1 FL=1